MVMLSTSAMAASISTYPMRVELEEGSGIASVRVINTGDSEANIQVRAMAWTQDKLSGKRQVEDTKELIFFPKIFTVPGNSQQLVRVGYQKKVGDKEKSFRLFIRELPVSKPGQTGARFAVEISMPAFIYPKGAVQPTKPVLQGIEVVDGVLMARLNNPAARYYSMHKLEIRGSKAGKEVHSSEISGWYVLAGVSKLFALKVSREDCLKMDSVHLTAYTKDDHSEAQFAVNSDLCSEIQKVAANQDAQ